MKSFFLLSLACLLSFVGLAQDAPQASALIPVEAQQSLPYHQIPDYPDEYNAATVAARMIDGLGYRYYWATEGLREEDLAYKPSDDSRAAGETLEHLYNLSNTILNATRKTANIRSGKKESLSFDQQRQKTLENFAAASQLLKASANGEVQEFELIYQRGEYKSSFPFWNLLNGQLADAIYHVGQIVAYRRASGNPLNPRVNVFTGKTRE